MSADTPVQPQTPPNPAAARPSESPSEAQSVKSAWSAVLRRRASVGAIAKAHRIRTQSVVSESVAADAAPVSADLIPDGVVPSSLAAIRRHNAAVRAGLAAASSASSASSAPSAPLASPAPTGGAS